MESEMMSVPIQLVQDLISAQKEQDQTNQTLINAVQYLQKEMTNQKARADKLEQRNSMLSKKMKTKKRKIRSDPAVSVVSDLENIKRALQFQIDQVKKQAKASQAKDEALVKYKTKLHNQGKQISMLERVYSMHTEVVKSVGKGQPAVQARELQNIKETINQSMDCYQHLRMEFDAMKKQLNMSSSQQLFADATMNFDNTLANETFFPMPKKPTRNKHKIDNTDDFVCPVSSPKKARLEY